MAPPRPNGVTPGQWADTLFDASPLDNDDELVEWCERLAANGYPTAPNQAGRDAAAAVARDDLRISRFQDLQGAGRRPGRTDAAVLIVARANPRWAALLAARGIT